MSDINVTEHVRLLIENSERMMREYIDARIASVEAGLQTVADAAAAALRPHVSEEVSGDDGAIETDEAAGEVAEEIADEIADEIAEESAEPMGALVVTEDGQMLEEVPNIVEELSPAEALDEIEPYRTHPLLRPVRWPWGR